MMIIFTTNIFIGMLFTIRPTIVGNRLLTEILVWLGLIDSRSRQEAEELLLKIAEIDPSSVARLLVCFDPFIWEILLQSLTGKCNGILFLRKPSLSSGFQLTRLHSSFRLSFRCCLPPYSVLRWESSSPLEF